MWPTATRMLKLFYSVVNSCITKTLVKDQKGEQFKPWIPLLGVIIQANHSILKNLCKECPRVISNIQRNVRITILCRMQNRVVLLRAWSAFYFQPFADSKGNYNHNVLNFDVGTNIHCNSFKYIFKWIITHQHNTRKANGGPLTTVIGTSGLSRSFPANNQIINRRHQVCSINS